MNAIRMTSACLGAVLLGGCMQARIEESREIATHITKDESVVILAKPQIEGAGAEDVFMDCISENLRGGKGGLQVHDNNEFVDQMFPWFEPSTAPANAAGLKVLLQRPGVTERLQEIGVRYVVWLDGNTKKTDGGGSVACAASPGGAGCIGVGWWEKESGYVASVWDMQTATEIGQVFSDLDLTKTQAQWEKAVTQAGSIEERMELFLDSMEQSAIAGSGATTSSKELVSDEEIDRKIQADVLAQEKTELSKLDQLESEIAKELGSTKQKD